MKSFSSFKARASKGFGLLEVILVFAIVIGAAAVVFTVFQSAKPSADSSNEASNLTTIATNLKSTYGINHSYTGLTKTTAIAAKAIPASMTDGTNITSQWGAVDVKANTDTSKFDITYNGVPNDACAKFVSGVAGFFPDGITIGGASVMSTTNPTQVDNSAVITACGAAAPVVVIFTGR